MTLQEAMAYLKTRKGLKHLIHINDEYGTWNEETQQYELPIDEAIALVIDELMTLYD